MIVWAAALATLIAARQVPPSGQTTFRGGVDVIELDVSALDKDRHPVHGLTVGDFTVTIDGVPRRILAFKSVDVPPPVPPAEAPWVRDVAPDVATNTHLGGRVVAIVIDDGSFSQVEEVSGHTSTAAGGLPVADLWAIQKTREIARAVVDDLGPDDLAAVMYTENNHTAQDFTSDRARLLAAIDKSALAPGSSMSTAADAGPLPGAMTAAQLTALADPKGDDRGSCFCGVCSIEALGRVADALRSLPQQRKIMIDISVGRVVLTPGIPAGQETCNLRRHDAMTDVFKQAQLANVTIQTVDPKGLTVGQVGTGDAYGVNPSTERTEFLRTVAETTGGRAVINDNDVQRQIPALLAESSSYYLLGVERPLTKDDGHWYPIKVQVSRPGVTVRTRTGYYAPTDKETKALANPSHGLDASVADALPKSDFPLEAAVAPFAAAKGKAELAIVLNVSEPNASKMARQEPVDLVVRAFEPENGQARGVWRQRVNLVWTASQAASGEYEVLTRMPVDPGRYELRLGLQTGDGHTASVYAYTEVPKFSDEPLSLSGLLLNSTPSPKSAPKDAFVDLVPTAPTARRTFRKTDHVTAFLRLYEGGSHALIPATITTRIVDTSNKQLGDGLRRVEAAAFGKGRSFDYRFDVPVRLPKGEYLLSVDVAAGGKTAQRALRFQVR